VLKKGWLEKSGPYIYSKRQQRYFTLKSDGKLIYEKMEGKNLVQHEIDLTRATAIGKHENDKIIVETAIRKWTFWSSTTSDRDEWLRAMTPFQCQHCTR